VPHSPFSWRMGGKPQPSASPFIRSRRVPHPSRSLRRVGGYEPQAALGVNSSHHAQRVRAAWNRTRSMASPSFVIRAGRGRGTAPRTACGGNRAGVDGAAAGDGTKSGAPTVAKPTLASVVADARIGHPQRLCWDRFRDDTARHPPLRSQRGAPRTPQAAKYLDARIVHPRPSEFLFPAFAYNFAPCEHNVHREVVDGLDWLWMDSRRASKNASVFAFSMGTAGAKIPTPTPRFLPSN
jgi:hypothetical protein